MSINDVIRVERGDESDARHLRQVQSCLESSRRRIVQPPASSTPTTSTAQNLMIFQVMSMPLISDYDAAAVHSCYLPRTGSAGSVAALQVVTRGCLMSEKGMGECDVNEYLIRCAYPAAEAMHPAGIPANMTLPLIASYYEPDRAPRAPTGLQITQHSTHPPRARAIPTLPTP